MISVFDDTFVILNLTVFSVLTTGALESGKNGTAFTQAAFMRGFGTFGIVFVAVCLCSSLSLRFWAVISSALSMRSICLAMAQQRFTPY